MKFAMGPWHAAGNGALAGLSFALFEGGLFWEHNKQPYNDSLPWLIAAIGFIVAGALALLVIRNVLAAFQD